MGSTPKSDHSTSISASKSFFAAQKMTKIGWGRGMGFERKRNYVVSFIRVTKREDNSRLENEKEVAQKD